MEDQAQAFRDYGVHDKDIIEMDCVYAGWQGWREVRWPERDASIRFGRSLAAVGVSDDDRLHKAAAASLASSTRKDTGTETVVTSAEEENKQIEYWDNVKVFLNGGMRTRGRLDYTLLFRVVLA